MTVSLVASTLAAVPMLVGFVTFFMGGGYLMFYLGLLISLVLLLGPARPSEEMASRIAERLDPPADPVQLWTELLAPDPD
ncbi:MAG: hypothetical protein R3258_10620 [Acidimicrobiia bacterium]|nr:hypothetical protein [Acidimicrobiia bacterium]